MADGFRAVPPTLARYRVRRALLGATAQTLRELSRDAIEAVVLWQGRVVSEVAAEATELVVPEQRAGRLHFDVPLDERLRLVERVTARGEFILVQVHTHPAEAFHSAADDRLAIPRHLGALSIVVPYFARAWDGDLRATSVHRHAGAGVWEELPLGVVATLFEVTP